MYYGLVVAHFVADFVCQSDWMALNKSKSWKALALHVFVYGWAFTLVYGSLMVAFSLPTFSVYVAFIAINMAGHFVQDAITSRMTSRLWFIDLKKVPQTINGVPVGYMNDPDEPHDYTKNWYWLANVNPHKRHWFFVVIGLDQLLHYLLLIWTAERFL